jgi:hypothetical protein
MMNKSYCYTSLFFILVSTQSVANVGFSQFPTACSRIFNQSRVFSQGLTYGLEIEFSVEKNIQILNDYKPYEKKEDGSKWTDKQWQALSLEQRKFEFLKPRNNSSFLIKLKSAPDYLPKSLHHEKHGTHEMTNFVFQTSEDFINARTILTERYGLGAVQAHVVGPTQTVNLNLLSFTVFMSDHAQLKSLENGFRKYLVDHTHIPAANFTHYVLGPQNYQIIAKSKSSILLAMSGDANNVISDTKLYSSSAIRGSIYNDNGLSFGVEHRQYSYDHSGIDQAVQKSTFAFNKNNYADYLNMDIHIVDEVSRYPELAKKYGFDFNKTQLRLKKIELYLHERFENTYDLRFFYPLRKWDIHPIILRLPPQEQSLATEKIMIAERNYILEYKRILSAENLTDAEILTQLRTAVAKWSYEADLYRHFNALF